MANCKSHIIHYKLLLTILALLVSTSLFAQNLVEVVKGNAIELPNPKGVDIVYLFENIGDAEIQTSINSPTWQSYKDGDSTFVASGTDILFPEHNTGYIVSNGTQRITFWVLDYAQCRSTLQSLSVNLDYENLCEETLLTLEATIPEMSYQNIYGQKQTISRTCHLIYNSLAWDGEQWTDSLCIETPRLQTTIIAGAPLQNTVFTIYDEQFTKELGIDADSISSNEFEAVAVAAQPTTITTTRGTERENEVERPIDETQLSGSAPLDIYFKANPTPGAKYFQWKLMKGNDLIAQRTDEEQRYTFDDYGEYRALLWVSNDYCATDSIEIKISVATSQLLVPNVFTPNGDGMNDEFRVMYRSIIDFHCWVYNRWGKKVFDWTDPAKGWDGNINGKPAAESAYFYVIRAIGADGKEYKLKGDINLLRGKQQ